jgi:hypothetical protein
MIHLVMQTGHIVKHDVREEDDYVEELQFYTRMFEHVVRELIADPRFDGHFLYKFQIYEDGSGRRVFCEANGCISFQIHASRIGGGVVPFSLVIYVDGTLLGKNISVRPIYGEFTCIVPMKPSIGPTSGRRYCISCRSNQVSDL